ncbi:hypothetical protein ACH492_22120 [Streptomyces sp. NPDC019443]|uniref:hypothetical protein n=1 Tax=Streptomyces sp. NPDC019443 TaxID=3365061 RepID=UPI0037A48313
MAGYRHKRKRINIKFEEPHEYAGLEVCLRGTNLGEFLALRGIGDVDLSDIGDQLKRFGESLISWNLLEEDGTPVPPTLEAVYTQDQDLMFALASQWMDVMAGVKAPLDESSPAGEPSLEASIPMESLSSSLVS